MVDPLRSGSESHDLGIGEGLSKSKSQHSLKSMSMPTPTPQQIDELFESLGSTFTKYYSYLLALPDLTGALKGTTSKLC